MKNGQSTELFDTVLVANRGEIACRVIRTLRRLGIASVAIYSEADAGARHVREADVALCVGPAAANESYLNIAAVVSACKASGAQAVHPGYGFLSENLEFAQALEAAGIAFIGPNIEALNVMGDKIRSKNHVVQADVPVVPGISLPELSDKQLIDASADIGFPLLIKPSAGGGGKGMQAVNDAEELPAALAAARRIAQSSFGDDTLFLERLVSTPRHIEVQILGDSHGNVVHLGERECSLQRRHQKVIEEAPSPLLEGLLDGAEIRAQLGQAACNAAASVAYTGAGTVEFLVSNDNPGEFFFMEMNTRLQVEHPVTEMVARVDGQEIDLVEWQIRIAAGEQLAFTQDQVTLEGHAVEARVYSESPAEGFLPATGTIVRLDESIAFRPGVRVDSSLRAGLVLSTNYDPMLAKVIAWGQDRQLALDRLDTALGDYVVLGVPTNLEYLRLLINDQAVRAGSLDTNLIERRLPDMAFRSAAAADYAAAAQQYWQEQAAEEAAAGNNVWGRAMNWRLNDRALRRAVFAGKGNTEVLTVQESDVPGVVSIASGATTETVKVPAGYVSAIAAGTEETQIFLGQGGWSIECTVLGREAQTTRNLAGIDKAEATAHPDVRSPMPGTVTVLAVASGDYVEAGMVLLAVEAMKMEHQLSAAVAGTVTLNVELGSQVKAGAIVATIKEELPEG